MAKQATALRWSTWMMQWQGYKRIEATNPDLNIKQSVRCKNNTNAHTIAATIPAPQQPIETMTRIS
eukprot:scaffold279530_cov19-Tisochrysis_lutea.AAC.1